MRVLEVHLFRTPAVGAVVHDDLDHLGAGAGEPGDAVGVQVDHLGA